VQQNTLHGGTAILVGDFTNHVAENGLSEFVSHGIHDQQKNERRENGDTPLF
jgi:hypothetical protein